MRHDSAKRIEAWFAEHDDGEFALAESASLDAVIAPSSHAGSILFTTKPKILAAVIETPLDSFVLGGYGLPKETYVRKLLDMSRARTLLFLGDMDPADLLMFLWLRERLVPQQIKYLGLSDTFLDAIGMTSADLFQIRLAPSEQEALPLVDTLFPDMCETLGPQCTQRLQQAHKIELEVLLQARTTAAKVLRSAILPDG